MKVKEDRNLIIFFIIMAIQCIAANIAHPITPTIIQNLHLPAYTFGLAFAGMAFTSFLFSPLWGKLTQKIGDIQILFIGCIGYALGQFLFSIAQTELTIMLGRMVSGLFVGGITTSYLTYTIAISTPDKRGRNLAISSTLMTVFSTFGYLIGGLTGDFSITLTFAIQCVMLIGCGILFKLCLKEEARDQQQSSLKSIVKEANPFRVIMDARAFMTQLLLILFVVTFVSSIASTAYDQCFNFYIKDQFQFKPSYNGMIKAAVGVISLIANSTLCLWIIRKKDVKRWLAGIFGVCAVSILAIVFTNGIPSFLAVNMIFFAFNAIYIPLLQSLCSDHTTRQNSGVVMGFYNSMKSMGSIVGSLFAGFIYAYGANLSFIYGSVLFVLCVVLVVFYIRKFNQKPSSI